MNETTQIFFKFKLQQLARYSCSLDWHLAVLRDDSFLGKIVLRGR